MFAVLRTLAPAVLLLASLSGQAATGIVLAHVAAEHVVGDKHADHGTGDHHATDHHAEPEGEHRGTVDGSEHTHQIIPSTATTPARVTCPSIDVQPYPALGRLGHFDRPAPCALIHLALPVLRAGPPEPQRHPILLL